MPEYPRRFWRALQTGVEVAVAAPDSPRLLGVRDGFRAFFQSRMPPAAGVLVVPQQDSKEASELPLSD
ncbi:MAG: hypothetical protein KDD47_28615, partial [Acidobacteria bacterium]|nr:hypothetical protein [Acidobacteriota bacterium]